MSKIIFEKLTVKEKGDVVAGNSSSNKDKETGGQEINYPRLNPPYTRNIECVPHEPIP